MKKNNPETPAHLDGDCLVHNCPVCAFEKMAAKRPGAAEEAIGMAAQLARDRGQFMLSEKILKLKKLF